MKLRPSKSRELWLNASIRGHLEKRTNSIKQHDKGAKVDVSRLEMEKLGPNQKTELQFTNGVPFKSLL